MAENAKSESGLMHFWMEGDQYVYSITFPQSVMFIQNLGNALFVQWWCVPSQRVTETFLFPRKGDALAGELNYSESTHPLHKTNPCFFKSFSRILENAKILKDLAHSPSWFDGPTFWRCFCSQKENNYSSSRLDSFNNT